jgi:hypothetical protein
MDATASAIGVAVRFGHRPPALASKLGQARGLRQVHETGLFGRGGLGCFCHKARLSQKTAR